ncbi:hypothetical protein HNQ57_000941 [Zhongshania antarctica]|uniref:Uncharacterized protein n=1 Tax=Zhongshania antarctica TaxID=641702 RepID=A0A840R2J2_9GAMM|nr:hypothetical protein [Zhongshania antarctica]MBB5186680.1 hypothetical protein [Zhongshania antarctica]
MNLPTHDNSGTNDRNARFEIHIDANPDRWRGGFQWAITNSGIEFDCGLSFTEEDAVNDAQQRIAEIQRA